MVQDCLRKSRDQHPHNFRVRLTRGGEVERCVAARIPLLRGASPGGEEGVYRVYGGVVARG